MKITKSFRKSILIKINTSGELIVKAPYFTSKKSIEGFVLKNKEWINEKKEIILERTKTFTEWENFLFLWEEYRLKFIWESKKNQFDWKNFIIWKKYKHHAAEAFSNFYRHEARKYIEKRIEFIADKFNLKFKKLNITSARTRWGSCTSAKNINFSYRLIMAPTETIDYVIVHELAHLKEMNHSKKFWTLVQKMMDDLELWDYKKHKKWLNKNWDKLIF